MSLTKRGEGALSISSDHDYTGGTLIAGGTVAARSAAALGQGMVAAETAVFVGGGALLRGDSHQTNAQMGVRVNF